MKKFKDSLIERLKDRDYASKYLSVALEEYEKDDNNEAFLVALRDVVEAQGGMSAISRRTSLNRSNLYAQLSEKGNPSFKTVDCILNKIGFKISISPQI